MDTNLPLIIISTPRSGSSMLLNHLCDTHNISKRFNEPQFHNRMEEFENYTQNNTNYAIKVHARDLLRFYQPQTIDLILNTTKAYRVRIRRKNVVEQIASFYTAKINNIWSYSVDDIEVEDIIINTGRIKHEVGAIKSFNEALDNIKTTFDLDVFYEDLLPMPNNKHKKTPKPSNYGTLLATIEDQYKCSL